MHSAWSDAPFSHGCHDDSSRSRECCRQMNFRLESLENAVASFEFGVWVRMRGLRLNENDVASLEQVTNAAFQMTHASRAHSSARNSGTAFAPTAIPTVPSRHANQGVDRRQSMGQSRKEGEDSSSSDDDIGLRQPLPRYLPPFCSCLLGVWRVYASEYNQRVRIVGAVGADRGGH